MTLVLQLFAIPQAVNELLQNSAPTFSISATFVMNLFVLSVNLTTFSQSALSFLPAIILSHSNRWSECTLPRSLSASDPSLSTCPCYLIDRILPSVAWLDHDAKPPSPEARWRVRRRRQRRQLWSRWNISRHVNSGSGILENQENQCLSLGPGHSMDTANVSFLPLNSCQ